MSATTDSDNAPVAQPPAAAAGIDAPRRKAKSLAPVVVIVAVVLIGIGVIGTSTSGSAGMYNYTLAQLEQGQADLAGRDIKVSGKVAKGSVRGDPGSRDFRFDLEDGQGHKLTVSYARLLPDPFEEGRDAIVQGKLEGATLVASNLTVKCPSRYADGGKGMSESEQQKYYQSEYKKHKAAHPDDQPPTTP